MGHCTCSLLRGSHAVADPSIFGYSIGMKLIALIIGLAAGFGVGVYWGVHHPSQAASLSAAEESMPSPGSMAMESAGPEPVGATPADQRAGHEPT